MEELGLKGSVTFRPVARGPEQGVLTANWFFYNLENSMVSMSS